MALTARMAMPATPASLVSFIQFPPPIRQVDRVVPFDLGRRPPPPRPEGGLAPSGAHPFDLSMRRWGRIDLDGDRGVARRRVRCGRCAETHLRRRAGGRRSDDV